MPDSPRNMRQFRTLLLAVLFCAAVARVSTMNDPFTRNHESTACGPMVCAARNMVRYGLCATRFRYIMNADEVPPAQFTYYNHHPPLVPMMMIIPSRLFGEDPWVYRLPGAVFSVLTTGLLFIMLARKFDWGVALAASCIHAFCPFSWMFGNMPDVVGTHLVFFGVLTIECYSRWSDTGRRGWVIMLCASWFCSAMCDWPAFFLPPLCAGHFLLTRPWRMWWRVIPFGAVSAGLLVALFVWLMGGGDESVLSQVTHRVNGKSDFGTTVTCHDWWVIGIEHYLPTTITLPVLMLDLVYVGWLVVMIAFRRAQLRAHDTTVLMLLWGIAHVTVGMESSYQHLWVWTVLVPGLCAAAALGGYSIWQSLPKRLPLLPGALRWTTAPTAVVFLGYSCLTARHLTDIGLTWQSALFQSADRVHPIEDSYTLADLGAVIRETVPPHQGLLTSEVGDLEAGTSEPALWFYADRQIRNGIRTTAQLDKSLGAGDYPLFYHFTQHGGPAPTWFIMPAQHHCGCAELAATLDARYAHWIKRGFILYYLGMKPTHGSDFEAS